MARLVRSAEWSGGSRGKVLVETTEWGDGHLISTVLRRAGFSTVTCPGPAGAGERCPLAAGSGCSSAEGADVVVHAFGPWDARNREVLSALRDRLPGVPLVVDVPPVVVEKDPDRYRGCTLLDGPLSASTVLEAVIRALEGPIEPADDAR